MDHEYEQFLTGVPKDERGEGYAPSQMSEPIILKRLVDYDRPNPTISQIQLLQLRVANDWAREHFSRGMDKQSMQPDSLSITIERFLAEEDSQKRSAGWPYNQRYQTKADALRDPKFIDELVKFIRSLDTEHPTYEPFALSLKSELLKQSKVDNKDTRMFMSAPITHHMACYQLFGKLQKHIMEKQLTWCTAGMVFQFGGWNAFLQNFPQFAKFFGIDIKGMDMSVSAEFWDCFLDFLRDILDAQFHVRITNLLLMALHCIMITPHGRIFIKHTGNPSGWYLTLLINSYVIYLLIAMLWITHFWSRPEMLKRSEFEYNMQSGICGDDSMISVRGSHYKWCNNAFIEDLWGSLGYKVKSLELSDKIEDLEYCGARSMLYQGVFVRVPRTEKFISSLKWVSNLDPCFRYQRACSLYYEVYPLPVYRDLIGRFLAYLEDKYRSALDTLPSSRLTKMQIDILHTGVGSDVLVTQMKNELYLEGRRSVIYDSPLNNSIRRGLRTSQPIQLQSRIISTDMPNNKQKKKAPKRAAAAAVVVRVNRAPKPTKNSKKRAARKSTSRELELSPCAKEYAYCLLNPCSSPPVCMPTTVGLISRKQKVWAKGSFSAQSADGYACIVLQPALGCMNNVNWGLVTSNASVGTLVPATSGAGVNAITSNSEYTSGTVTTSQASWRLVSACVRIRYTGFEMWRGGSIFSLIEPDHQTLAGKNISGLRLYASCSESKMTADWTELVWTGPIGAGELDYTQLVAPGTSVPSTQPCMAMALLTPTTQLATFDYEIYGNYEWIGPSITGKTPSYPDPVGQQLVAGGLQAASAAGMNGDHGSKTFMNKAIMGIGTVAKMAMTHIGGGGEISVNALAREILPKLTSRSIMSM